MNIEELIKNRKNELDQNNPPEELWEQIRSDWKDEKQTRFFTWKAAAVVFIAATLGLLIHNIRLQQEVETLASLGDLSEEYQEMENDYLLQINQIETSLSIEEVKSNEEYQWMFEEMAALEEVNDLYRQDIGKINEDQLVEVLIDYYEKKLRLLKKLELEIKRANKYNRDEEMDSNSVRM